MDPYTLAVVGKAGSVAGGMLAGQLAKRFGTAVIERWSRRRARQFFEQFCIEIAAGHDDEAHQRLDEILEDERCSEALFDAYRAVCLTRSKTLGPRIIAVLTAEIVSQRREATWAEQTIADATEQMTDQDIIDFVDFIDSEHREALNPDCKRTSVTSSGGIEIEWHKEQFDSNWHRETSLSLTWEIEETWAPTAKRISMLSYDLKERTWEYREDSERYCDEPGSVREIAFWAFLSPACLDFSRIVHRVLDSRDSDDG